MRGLKRLALADLFGSFVDEAMRGLKRRRGSHEKKATATIVIAAQLTRRED
jgi:hypothetical protein